MIAMFILALAAMPPTPELIKILVTALLSFITAVALDPLRNSVARHLTARRAVKVLYFRIGSGLRNMQRGSAHPSGNHKADVFANGVGALRLLLQSTPGRVL